MMQHVLIASPGPPAFLNYNVFDGVVVNRYPVKNPSKGNNTECFSKLVEGDKSSVLVKHISVVGETGCSNFFFLTLSKRLQSNAGVTPAAARLVTPFRPAPPDDVELAARSHAQPLVLALR